MSISAKGSVEKEVLCESCGHTYSYTMERTATGTYHGFVRDGAELARRETIEAFKNLELQLANDCNVVPCPKCKALTAEMRGTQDFAVFASLGLMVFSGGLLWAIWAFGTLSKIWFVGFGIITAGALLLSIFLFVFSLATVLSRPIRIGYAEKSKGKQIIPNLP